MVKQKEIEQDEDIKKLVKNFNLLRIVEKLESRKTSSQKSFFTDRERDKSFLNIEYDKPSKNDKLDKDKFSNKQDKEKNKSSSNDSYNVFNIDQKCKKHSLLIHSYAIGTNLLFCDICIQETNLKTYPLPNVYIYTIIYLGY